MNKKSSIKSTVNRLTKGKFFQSFKPEIKPYQNRSGNIFNLAEFLGKKFHCNTIIDIGLKYPKKLNSLSIQFQTIGISQKNLIKIPNNYKFLKWNEWDHEKLGLSKNPEKILRKSLIICSEMIESKKDNSLILNILKNFLNYSPICLVSTNFRNNQVNHSHNSTNPSFYFQELTEFENLLFDNNFNISHTGLIINNKNSQKDSGLAILENNNSKIDFRNLSSWAAPKEFKVIAISMSHNESDIISSSIKHLTEQDIPLYLLDNWSTDGTYEIAKEFVGNGVIGIERFPPDGPAKYFSLEAWLNRTEKLSRELDADWFYHQSIDELRSPPWPEVKLKDAIYAIDNTGFNAIDHTVINFHPVDDFFDGSNFEKYFKHFDFGKRPTHFKQIHAWKNLKKPVSLGGHEVSFEGRRVYPYKFLLKHYPIRSQRHGEKKLFKERKPRYLPEARKKGFHHQYDKMENGYNFIQSSDDLEKFDHNFYKKYLVELISGVGINS